MIGRYKILLLLFLVCAGRYIYTCRLAYCPQEKSAIPAQISSIHEILTQNVRAFLPSPHAELALGMTFGIDNFADIPKFKQKLRDTGTIHVVVVSGFNISLVSGLLLSAVGSKYKPGNLIRVLLLTLGYAVFTGFEPPVIRAWIMSTILLVGSFYGRVISTIQVLVFAGLVMVLYKPSYLESLSFQLSFAATLGLLTITPLLDKLVTLPKDISSSVAAQAAVWPLISYNFGTFSIAGLFLNPLILWVVPIITVLCFPLAFMGLLLGEWGRFSYMVVYPLLNYFVLSVEFFSRIIFSSITLKISAPVLLAYYVLLIFFIARHYV
ncbi:hypothetical protein A3K34_00510 [candidate division WWE3 bacterium RIFOXYC1_FULL_40_10]|uniref:ComEC/Rec2-related protein domain-containing protein n=1 Tax=candidate division WWE3 bacterium RIFOXYA2_FULL_46_9 TaxID=1802636 RepID=A0A1F4W3D0_UNCKA|nr:MAG: hypothetical protein A3K58_00510 [candidate division WWE3 bacterium RIFOXYB1_FULL_40_22]OGC61366.1 MAG: hypothetical protein A3K37_00510 [candidate division WWE3 bacterium RIFOXYA1_FULL_40_11]OGC63934.1 MAG: hypothetical protein A2264_02520 [candidate division WWE3 bacterium RIFOXYA2_FULL_46_9]OGC65356.1 MAG: hypothetical protein A2326_04795 [candidate division WWE3 bacterium RIFOXYB2_FULL_41_6]OGC65749.1 MAG: hypothetical protein A3K34_00510 [candidate division WWE3 bacterium RIFOXYC1_